MLINADLLAGDNIISSYGTVWKGYRSIAKPGLQKDFDGNVILRNANTLCDLIQQAAKNSAGGAIPMQELLQRYTIANSLEAVLDTKSQVGDIKFTPDDYASVHLSGPG